MEINKAIASVLVVGIAFMLSAVVADGLIQPHHLDKTVLKIEGVGAPAAAPKVEKLPPIAPLMAAADPAKGGADAKKLCAACHTFTKDGKNGVGPHLWDVMTRGHTALADYSYSKALEAKKGHPWSYEELNEWLHKPSAYAPGTKMGFAGIKNDKERADVIAYLRSLSENPPPLPKVEPAAAPAAAPAAPAPAGAAPAAPAPAPKAAPAAPAAPAPAAPAAPKAPAADGAKGASLPPIAPFLATADLKAGEKEAKKLCSACHTFTENGRNGVGPHLWDVMTRGHAALADFNYSAALKAKKGPWTYEELNVWLHKPSDYAPGTRMAFAGIRKEQDRANVILYLRSLASNPPPLPVADAPAAVPAKG
jgi:cytochrome c